MIILIFFFVILSCKYGNSGSDVRSGVESSSRDVEESMVGIEVTAEEIAYIYQAGEDVREERVSMNLSDMRREILPHIRGEIYVKYLGQDIKGIITEVPDMKEKNIVKILLSDLERKIDGRCYIERLIDSEDYLLISRIAEKASHIPGESILISLIKAHETEREKVGKSRADEIKRIIFDLIGRVSYSQNYTPEVIIFVHDREFFDLFKRVVDLSIEEVYRRDEHGRTVLHMIAYRDNMEAYKYLIDRDDIDITRLNVVRSDGSKKLPKDMARGELKELLSELDKTKES